MNIRGPLVRLGPWLFWIAVVVRLLPEFVQPCFPTLDGPSHLLNARILLDLTLGKGNFVHYFATDPFPEPNLLGHVLLALLMTVLPALAAEKVLQLTTALVLAWSFRRLMTVLAPEQRWAPFMVLPYLVSFTTIMGFINFNLSLPLFLLVLAESERLARDGYVLKPWRAAGLMLLLHLSHLSSFALASALVLGRGAWALWRNEAGTRVAVRRVLRCLLALGIVPWTLTLGYVLLHGDHAAAAHRFELSELGQWILDGRGWITYGHDAEVMWTRIIAITLIIVGALATIRFVQRRSSMATHGLFWGLCTLGCAAGYFILPDSMAGGTFASPRLLLFLMLMMACWTAAVGIDTRLGTAAAVIIGAAGLPHMLEQRRTAEQLAQEANDLLTIGPSIPEGAVVLPLNYSDNWLHSNFSNYIGADRHAVVLDNFVATAPFAPVQWRPEALPYSFVGDYDRSRSPCIRTDDYVRKGEPLIDHVLTWKFGATVHDSCAEDVRRQLNEHFVLTAISPRGDAVLYKRK